MSNTTEYQYVKKNSKNSQIEWTNNRASGYLTTSQTLKRFHFNDISNTSLFFAGIIQIRS